MITSFNSIFYRFTYVILSLFIAIIMDTWVVFFFWSSWVEFMPWLLSSVAFYLYWVISKSGLDFFHPTTTLLYLPIQSDTRNGCPNQVKGLNQAFNLLLRTQGRFSLNASVCVISWSLKYLVLESLSVFLFYLQDDGRGGGLCSPKVAFALHIKPYRVRISSLPPRKVLFWQAVDSTWAPPAVACITKIRHRVNDPSADDAIYETVWTPLVVA